MLKTAARRPDEQRVHNHGKRWQHMFRRTRFAARVAGKKGNEKGVAVAKGAARGAEAPRQVQPSPRVPQCVAPRCCWQPEKRV